MLRRGDFLMIQNRLNEGAFLKDIAVELGVSAKTVSRAVKRKCAVKLLFESCVDTDYSASQSPTAASNTAPQN